MVGIHRRKSLKPILEQKNCDRRLGAAFDIGTTTVAGMLWDLEDGSLVKTASAANPQRIYGADVISRIRFCGQGQGNLEVMHRLAVDCLNGLLKDLTCDLEAAANQVEGVCAVGNPAMSHLFLGENPSGLAQSPFSPAFTGAQERTAGELGLDLREEVPVYVLPNIGGHVGSDLSAVLLASRLGRRPGEHLAVDIGTNGEILLASNGRIWACSTAAGPAFEGAAIHQGMRAEPGAVESVQIDEDVRLQVIGNSVPIGICGSGIIDAVAELLNAEIVESSGRLLTKEESVRNGISEALVQRIQRFGEMACFVLAWKEGTVDREPALILTQKDIREVQLAKGAILAGIRVLMKRAGILEQDLNGILLAGAFGNYIRKENALRIGMLPQISEKKITSIGNAAGAGASMALLSEGERNLAVQEALRTERVELSEDPEFQNIFVESMNFPKKTVDGSE